MIHYTIKINKQFMTSFTVLYLLVGGDKMAINKDKTRISVTLTKEEYQLLKNKAIAENRSISNLIGLLVKQYLRS